MAHYELLEALDPKPTDISLSQCELPELVYLDDPATSVMHDFRHNTPPSTSPEACMEDAINEMKLTHSHLLIVVNEENQASGIITTEDVLGEKPIKLIQERRFERDQVTVKMLMTPLAGIPAFSYQDISHARVGNIVNTLKALHQHYALIIEQQKKETLLRGLFNTSQISKQLHTEVASNIAKAESVSELNKGT
jgi:CBS-domain-containing membrane protein